MHVCAYSFSSCKFLFVPLPVGPLRLDVANTDPFYAPLFIPLALDFAFLPFDDLKVSMEISSAEYVKDMYCMKTSSAEYMSDIYCGISSVRLLLFFGGVGMNFTVDRRRDRTSG